MNVDVLVPWRTDHGHRERLWQWVAARWAELGAHVVTGTDGGEGPFNVAAAVNAAAATSTADVYVLWGADWVPDRDVLGRAAEIAAAQPWAALYSRTGIFTARHTEAVLDGRERLHDRNLKRIVEYCTAALVVHASVWRDVGGYDPRFVGWGCEDTALRHVLNVCHPVDVETYPGLLRTLWHPSRRTETEFAANKELLRRYLAATDPAAVRALIAERHC